MSSLTFLVEEFNSMSIPNIFVRDNLFRFQNILINDENLVDEIHESLKNVKEPASMDRHGDEGVKPSLRHRLEGLPVQKHQITQLRGSVEDDHNHDAVIFLRRSWSGHKEWLAVIMMLLDPDLGN